MEATATALFYKVEGQCAEDFFRDSLGLRDFDVANIDGSIPGLLDGMKLAFSTSVLGMVTSLILKILYSLRQDNSVKKDGVSAEDLYSMLNEIKKCSEESILMQRELLTGIRTAITGNEDSSLLTQIQKLRTNFSDQLGELKESFNSFADKVSENNSKALIEALESVIKDFNAKINEQFGENFRHLNEAVQAMLTWQQEYKVQVESLTEAFKETSNGVKEIEGSIRNVKDNLSLIPETMQALQDLIKNINAETEYLGNHLEAFKEMKEKAVEAFPVIQENLESMTGKLSAEMEKNGKHIAEMLTQYAEKMSATMSQNMETVTEGIDSYTRQIREFALEQQKELQENAQSMRQSFEQTLKGTNELLKTSFEKFDEEMKNEIERTIRQMGSLLGSLSEKFVKDYEQFSSTVKEWVELVK